MQLQGLPQTRTNHVFRDSEMPESLQGRDKVDWQQRLIRHCQLKPVMIWPQLVALVLTYPTFLWIVHASGALSLLFGFGALSLIGSLPFSAFYATFTEALLQNIRGGVFATIYAVAIASFGGSAQLVVTWLLHVSGDPLAPSWYLLLAAIVDLVAMGLMPETAPVKVGRPYLETDIQTRQV